MSIIFELRVWELSRVEGEVQQHLTHTDSVAGSASNAANAVGVTPGKADKSEHLWQASSDKLTKGGLRDGIARFSS